jgi:hypothetical protein
MDEPTRPDPRLDGSVDRSKPRTARYHAIAASMSPTRMPTWFIGSGETDPLREVSGAAPAGLIPPRDDAGFVSNVGGSWP